MQRRKRILFGFLIVAILLVLPTTALARKGIFKARLTTGAELHEVVGSNASGGFVITATPTGYSFTLNVRNLSGPATGAHIHGPATESENAPVAISICGNPAPSAVATCNTDAEGNLVIEGEITSVLMSQWGITGATLRSWFNNDTSYVNVHTSLNPAGEVRGQISLLQ